MNNDQQTMSPEAQRVAIARACGWTANPCSAGGQPAFVAKTPDGDTLWRGDSSTQEDEAIFRNCPNYTEDLNAMHEAEKVLTKDQQSQYWNHLRKITDLSNSKLTDEEFYGVYSHFLLLHSTAVQRCKAFLLTIGLWQPDTQPKGEE